MVDQIEIGESVETVAADKISPGWAGRLGCSGIAARPRCWQMIMPFADGPRSARSIEEIRKVYYERRADDVEKRPCARRSNAISNRRAQQWW